MRLLLLNQYGPGSTAPTARILGDLAIGLQKCGHHVTLVEAEAAYGVSRRGIGRITHELRAHLALLWRSFRAVKPDAVISLTSPACLAVTAGFVAKLRNAKHFHWAMDLYPEVGVRLGELKSGALTRTLSNAMGRAYKAAHHLVTLDEDMRDYLRATHGVDSTVIPPFPPQVEWPNLPAGPRSTKRWLYSGNFGRAHEIDVLLQVQKRLEENSVDAELLLQGHGAQFAASRDAAERLNLRRVQWRPPAPAEALGQSLLESDVLVVTRRPEMKGLLLPSKLVLAELSGKAVLWIGDRDGKTARRLAESRRHGVFTSDEGDAIAAWLQQAFAENSHAATRPTSTDLARNDAIAKWMALLQA